jgi:hypothetical protein
MSGYGVGYFFFFLADFFAFFAFFAFLAMFSLRGPKSWIDASRPSACMHTEYTTIAKLILRAAKKVNGGHTVGQRDRMRPSRDAWTRCASQGQDGEKFACGRKTKPTTGKPNHLQARSTATALYPKDLCVPRAGKPG